MGFEALNFRAEIFFRVAKDPSFPPKRHTG